ncbi:hypothetical protein SCALM49S_00892 [Streptomyces californicus]
MPASSRAFSSAAARSFASAACRAASFAAFSLASASFFRSSSASRAFSSAVSRDSSPRASLSLLCTSFLLEASVACVSVRLSRLFTASARFFAADACCVRNSLTAFCCRSVARSIIRLWSKYPCGFSARKNVAMGAMPPRRGTVPPRRSPAPGGPR